MKEQQEKQGAVGQLADKKKEHVAIQCDIIQQHSVGPLLSIAVYGWLTADTARKQPFRKSLYTVRSLKENGAAITVLGIGNGY